MELVWQFMVAELAIFLEIVAERTRYADLWESLLKSDLIYWGQSFRDHAMYKHS